MTRLPRKLVIQALQALKQAAAWPVAGICAVPSQQSVRGISSSLQRSLVLPKLLDIHSNQYQLSSQRMSGLLSDMTQELEKVCSADTPCNEACWSGCLKVVASCLAVATNCICSVGLCYHQDAMILDSSSCVWRCPALHRYALQVVTLLFSDTPLAANSWPGSALINFWMKAAHSWSCHHWLAKGCMVCINCYISGQSAISDLQQDSRSTMKSALLK